MVITNKKERNLPLDGCARSSPLGTVPYVPSQHRTTAGLVSDWPTHHVWTVHCSIHLRVMQYYTGTEWPTAAWQITGHLANIPYKLATGIIV